MGKVLCGICQYENVHLVGTIHVKESDNYQTTEVIVNHEFSIPVKVKYPYRSQNNVHLLFACEDGHYFIKSFDGHKGYMFEDENELMDGLAVYLNEKYNDEPSLTLALDFELLGHIENFLKSIK